MPCLQSPRKWIVYGHKVRRCSRGINDPIYLFQPPRTGAGGLNEASKAHAQVFEEKGWVKGRTLQRTDPPEHSHYRKILGRVFTKRAVDGMIPRIDEITSWFD